MENIEHTEVLFLQYLHEYNVKICPDHGDIKYVDGKVQCSVHLRGNDFKSDDEQDDVPFL